MAEQPSHYSRDYHRQIISLILRPIAKFCIRRSFSVMEFVEIAKQIFVNVAEEEISKTSKKINVSRLSVLTGLSRKKVTNIFRKQSIPSSYPASLFWGVIGRWEQDRRFSSKSGEPRILSCHGDNSEFIRLVASVSKHISPSTVLFELQRNGAAEVTPKGVKLIRRTYAVGADQLQGYEMLSQELDALISAIDENLTPNLPDERINLHLRTEYDNVNPKKFPEIKAWVIAQGREFHRRVRDYLAKFDQDTDPDSPVSSSKSGHFIVSAFSYAFEQDKPRT